MSVGATVLDDIRELNESGSSWLALRLLDRYQPDLQEDPRGWAQWESYRLAVYHKLENWSLLLERIQNMQSSLPDEQAQWLILEGVRAQLEQGKVQTARQLLMSLLWGQHGQLDALEERIARQYLVKSYLLDSLASDAFTAQKQFQAEFGTQDDGSLMKDWKLVQAQIYLLNDNLPQASVMLSELDIGQDHPLQLLIRLRQHKLSPEYVITVCRRHLDQGAKAADVISYWAVLAEAAALTGDGLSELDALEHGLAALDQGQRISPVFNVQVDRLWEVYEQMEKTLTASLPKPPQTDHDWLQTAAALPPQQAKLARAIYAYLTVHAKSAPVRNQAHQLLADNILQSGLGDGLLFRLYLDSHRFPAVFAVPAVIRHVLIGRAISKADTPLASRLMRGLDEAPEGVDVLDWRLRQARVHIMAGNHQQGTEVILGMLKDIPDFAEEQQDRLVQVLFDLQAIGEHKTVIPLFEIVFNRATDIQRKREMVFWIAESMGELKAYDEAARYYLKSATLLDRNAMDMWAQSARFKAAEMLASAGLPADARKIYQQLLEVTVEPGRRSYLEKQIQQLVYRQR